MNSPQPQPKDIQYMLRALELARRGRGRVEPNPMVGCVLVKAKRIVGEGWHRRFGGPHAEVFALEQAGATARGATAYVTLEPCNYHGKTPPCTHALRQAGVSKVISAMRDPNPLIAGKGLRALRRAGIGVSEGLLNSQAEQLNAPYLKRLHQGTPYLIAKWAQSIDGKIATASGDSKWISGPLARKKTHRIRACVDGIIIGSGTLLQDDPSLTCRDVPIKRVAQRIILDTRLRSPLNCRLVRTASDIPTIIFTSQVNASKHKSQLLRRAGVNVLGTPLKSQHLDLRAVLRKLAKLDMTNLLLEGGGQVLGAALDLKLVDEAYVFVAPLLIGGHGAVSALSGEGLAKIASGTRLKNLTTRRVGPDLLYYFRF